MRHAHLGLLLVALLVPTHAPARPVGKSTPDPPPSVPLWGAHYWQYEAIRHEMQTIQVDARHRLQRLQDRFQALSLESCRTLPGAYLLDPDKGVCVQTTTTTTTSTTTTVAPPTTSP